MERQDEGTAPDFRFCIEWCKKSALNIRRMYKNDE